MSSDDQTPDKSNEVLSQMARDVDAVEKKMAGEIEPGLAVVFLAVGVFAVLGSLALPHTGRVLGWDVLIYNEVAQAASIGLPSRLFVAFALVFGGALSILAILTRRWVIALIALAGSAVTTVLGMLAIWSRQTLSTGAMAKPDAPGPNIGLVIGWVGMALLVALWLHVVWRRSAVLLAAEEERRQKATDGKDPLQWRERRDPS